MMMMRMMEVGQVWGGLNARTLETAMPGVTSCSGSGGGGGGARRGYPGADLFKRNNS